MARAREAFAPPGHEMLARSCGRCGPNSGPSPGVVIITARRESRRLPGPEEGVRQLSRAAAAVAFVDTPARGAHVPASSGVALSVKQTFMAVGGDCI
jgi:hypothetical protein